MYIVCRVYTQQQWNLLCIAKTHCDFHFLIFLKGFEKKIKLKKKKMELYEKNKNGTL